MKPGTLVVVNSDEPHGAFSTGMRYICLIVDADFCHENGWVPENVRLKSCIEDPFLKEAFADIESAFASSGPTRQLAIRSAVLRLIAYLVKNYTDSRTARPSTIEPIKLALRYIREHYNEPITLDDVAFAAGLSRYYFSREFRRVTGMTFVPYLNTMRCEEAAHLLKNGSTVTEACYNCGFRDIGYFSRMFRHLIGKSPSEIKKQ